jgi:hypothetical protein
MTERFFGGLAMPSLMPSYRKGNIHRCADGFDGFDREKIVTPETG